MLIIHLTFKSKSNFTCLYKLYSLPRIVNVLFYYNDKKTWLLSDGLPSLIKIQTTLYFFSFANPPDSFFPPKLSMLQQHIQINQQTPAQRTLTISNARDLVLLKRNKSNLKYSELKAKKKS